MSAFVIITGSFGMVAAYAIGLWIYGHHVEQKLLEYLAIKFRDDKPSFDLWMYNLSIQVTKKQINNEENKI
jgi:hypothetical protein